VAHSISNQMSQQVPDSYSRRKQSIGSSSFKPGSHYNQVRGASSGRKLLVATANTTYKQMAGS
jgi:hypothetical protein